MKKSNIKKVLHLDSNHFVLKQGLENLGFENEGDFTSNEAQVLEKISNYQGLVIRSRLPVGKTFLKKATQLQFIIRVGAGLENIDTDFAKEKKIFLISAPEGNRDAVAEHCIGMLLCLFNRILLADKQIREGIWQRKQNTGVELKGKTVGIIGYGNMGKCFAKKIRSFGVRVLCYDIQKNLSDTYATQVSLQELQEQSDIVSLHTPCTPSTRGLVNKKFIHHFAKPFYLINTARGTAVVLEDLVSALKSKKVLGACLDVFEYEKTSFENFFENNALPPAFRYLLYSEKVILSPHVAGWTRESQYKLAKVCLEKLKNFLSVVD